MGVKTLLPWRLGTGARPTKVSRYAVQRDQEFDRLCRIRAGDPAQARTALIQNRAGQFVTPEAKTFQTAAASAEWGKTTDFNLMLTDAPGDEAYPITATVFVLMHRQPASPRRSRAALSFFRWALEKGGQEAASLGYVPLPPSLVGQVGDYWSKSFNAGS